MIRRLTEPRTENDEFNRALALRGTWWVRTARPGTYYLSFSQALTGWWREKWPTSVWWWACRRYGRWYVRDCRDVVWGPYMTAATARRVADQFDDLDPGLATVERVP